MREEEVKSPKNTVSDANNSLTGRFTQSEIDKGVGERKEDSFYEFDKTLSTGQVLNPSQDDSLSMDLDINVPEGGGGGVGDGEDISTIMIINGFPTSVTLKGIIPD